MVRYKTRIGYLLAVSMLLIGNTLYAQMANTVLSTPITSAAAITATQSITLNPGFSADGVNGAVSLSIAGPAVQNCVPLAATPSADQNYIQTPTPRQPFIDATTLASKTTCEVMQTIQYVDGLGRSLQTVQVKANPDATRDVIQPIAYDQFGREATKYLPYTTSSGIAGSYRSDALTLGNGVFGFYNPTGSGTSGTPQGNGLVVIPIPSASTAFEPSPLNRVIEQGAPGADWQLGGHTVKMDYASNDASSLSTGTGFWAKQFGVNIDATTGARTLVDQGAYGANQLYLTVSKDENWISGKDHSTEEYKDKEGHIVLKRTFNGAEILSTYYVYDDFGNLSYVLPPKAEGDGGLNSATNQSTIDNLCYQYVYDERQRLIQKRIPGKDWEYMVYNKLDQVVATQDANQRLNNQWVITKYDALGRVVVSGIWNNGNTSMSRTALQGNVNAQTQQWENKDNTQTYGYTLTNTYPNALDNVLSVNYYDDYNFPSGFSPPAYVANSQIIPAMPSAQSTMTTGLLTGSLTAILNGTNNNTSTANMLWSASYYDDKGQVIQTDAQHYLGGTLNAGNYDQISNSYDFTNAVTQSIRIHHNATSSSSPAVITIANNFVYDHMGRRRQSFEQINGGTNVLISQTDYNEIGQLMTKHLHSEDSGASYLQDVAYQYNERGWLSQSSALLFEEQLQYNSNNIQGVSPTAQWNGNIASQSWGTATMPNNTSYTYSYDALNRLTDGTSTNGYHEQNITYDKMGNIGTLKRYWNSTLIDNLTYGYMAGGNSTNQLQTVTDASLNAGPIGYKTGTYSYGYDANGNLNADNSKGLGITYNLLNLPQTNTLPAGTINYIYDAGGRKLRKTSTLGSGTTTDYISGIQYTNGNIDFIQSEEGRVLNLTGTPNYEYTLTDHLGNSRVIFDSHTGSGSAKQTDDYMPFGMEISKSISGTKNEYLYNRKELQEELGQYDYGARFYDPVIARWASVDPLAELGRRWSPYNYVMNNPIRNIDPDGMWTETANGYTSDNAEEAQAFFKHLQSSQQGGDKNQKQNKNNKKEQKTHWERLLPSFDQKGWDLMKQGKFKEYIEYYNKNFIPMPFFPSFGAAAELGEFGETVVIAGNGLKGFQVGNIIGWGLGQGPAEVEKTVQLTQSVTEETIDGYKAAGVTREMIQKELTRYVNAMAKGGKKLTNSQLIPRKELMEKILKLWK